MLAHLLYFVNRTQQTKYFAGIYIYIIYIIYLGLKEGFEGVCCFGIFNKYFSIQLVSIIFQIVVFIVVCLIANETASINYKYESMTYPISLSVIDDKICVVTIYIYHIILVGIRYTRTSEI